MDMLRIMLKILKDHELYGKFNEYEFCLRLVAFLVHILSGEGIQVDPILSGEGIQVDPEKTEAKGLGTQVKLRTTFNPQTDGQAKRTIQTLEDMLRACMIDFKVNWDDHLSLIELGYNNNYHYSIGMTPFETLYGWRCTSTISWFEVGEVSLIGPELVHEDPKKVRFIRERLKMA
ncbi:hypothetical protein MTR67_040158 [Solanum verrucosum]|uniref:Integrase catalytic domain-containing protein n=1 Tax=Solanum verrucosum TaxID=315347 RepID=A0AAF0ZR52_SOLVR|nr:hypothetical protein MTR67_040158 [Solanum verrucosum]